MCKLYEPRNSDFWGKCIWKERFSTSVIPHLKKVRNQDRNADFWDKCFWKKRFSANVVPYLKTVCITGWIDMGPFGGPKCNLCYDYFLQDLDISNCEMCGQFNHGPAIYEEQTLQEYLENDLTRGCFRGKWVRITKATKFEDVKNIHKKLGYFALVPFKVDFIRTYFRIMGREVEF